MPAFTGKLLTRDGQYVADVTGHTAPAPGPPGGGFVGYLTPFDGLGALLLTSAGHTLVMDTGETWDVNLEDSRGRFRTDGPPRP